MMAEPEPEPAFEPGEYRVTFDRIGRSHPAPLVTTATSGPDLAERVYQYARPNVMSSELDVHVRYAGTGLLVVGDSRPAGHFTWQRTGATTE